MILIKPIAVVLIAWALYLTLRMFHRMRNRVEFTRDRNRQLMQEAARDHEHHDELHTELVEARKESDEWKRDYEAHRMVLVGIRNSLEAHSRKHGEHTSWNWVLTNLNQLESDAGIREETT